MIYRKKFEEVDAYSQRMRGVLGMAVGVMLLFGAMIIIQNGIVSPGLIFLPFTFLMIYRQGYVRNKTFIISFDYNGDNIEINYSDKGLIKVISDEATRFRISRRYAPLRPASYYLQINYNDIELRQYEIFDWNAKRMQEVINAIYESQY